MGVGSNFNGVKTSAGTFHRPFPDDAAASRRNVVLCSETSLLRDCLRRALLDANYNVHTVTSVAEWLDGTQETEEPDAGPLILMCIGFKSPADPEVRRDIDMILAQKPQPRLVIEGEVCDPAVIIETMHAGTKGYFPPDTPLDMALLALEMVSAGGVYLPPSVLPDDSGKRPPAPMTKAEATLKQLTPRQRAVVAALRQGKSNKIIAYELNMCESTVKVHVRNIMKRLDARNRTEVAFLTQKLFQTDDALSRKQSNHLPGRR